MSSTLELNHFLKTSVNFFQIVLALLIFLLIGLGL